MESTKKLLELLSEFNKVVEYKINIQNKLFYVLSVDNQGLKFENNTLQYHKICNAYGQI
jgi:hypothetical protein